MEKSERKEIAQLYLNNEALIGSDITKDRKRALRKSNKVIITNYDKKEGTGEFVKMLTSFAPELIGSTKESPYKKGGGFDVYDLKDLMNIDEFVNYMDNLYN